MDSTINKSASIPAAHRRLKVYYVIDYYNGPYAGTEKQLYLLITAMAARGHDVRLVVFRHTPYTRQVTEFPCPIELHEIHKMLSLHTLIRMWKLRRKILQDRPDVVHVFFNDAAILVPPWCTTAHTAVITSRRDLGFWYSKAIIAGLRLANTWVVRIVCNSEAVARVVAAREHVKDTKLTVIPNALPEATDRQSAHADNQAQRPPIPELDRAEVNICLVANIRELKRIDDLVHAAARVLQSCRNTRFWIAGEVPDTPYARTLLELPQQLDIADRLTFIGKTENSLELIRRCDIGVLTSRSEGLSNSIMEYMACGLPVVCSDVGGNPELIRHGENGYLFPVGDITQLTTQLIELCRDPDKRTAMGAISLQRAREFKVDSIVDRYVQLYVGMG